MEEEAFAARCEDLVRSCRLEDAAELEDVFYADNNLLKAWWEPAHLDRVAALRAALPLAPATRLVPDGRVAPHLMAFFRHALVPYLEPGEDAQEAECFFVSALVNSAAERLDAMPDEESSPDTQAQRILVDRRAIVHAAVDALAGDDEPEADRLLVLLLGHEPYEWAEDEISRVILRAHLSSKRARVE